MGEEKELTKSLIDILAKRSATPEEKKVQDLIKSALLSENLLTFINETEAASNGLGTIHSRTVKGVVEYAKAHNEAQIRTKYAFDNRVETLVEQENNRLTSCEVWVLGTLARMGLLKD